MRKNNRIKKTFIGCFISVLFLAVYFAQVFAAGTVSMSIEEINNDVKVKATYDISGLNVLAAGVLMADTDAELNFETAGRRKILFTEMDANNSCVLTLQNTPAIQKTVFRAFLVAKGSDGVEKTFFSSQFTPASYEQDGNMIIGNIIYRRIEGGLEVVGVVNKVKDLVIPEKASDLTVIRVADNAFENDSILTTIDLPDTIQIIGKRAFAGCSSLAKMY